LKSIGYAMLSQSPSDLQLLVVRDVLEKLKVSRSTLYANLDEAGRYYLPDFPKPRRRGRRTLFLAHEIDAYIDGLPLAKGGKT
jgi:predicted DNA-binding transcriptional regulator AlpA